MSFATEPLRVSGRPTGVNRTIGITTLAMLSLVVAACSSTGADERAEIWSAPDPPSDFASGLTIGFLPDGFTFVWNEGHETATFHVFESADATLQFSVGRQIATEPYPFPGEEVTRNGRTFTLVETTRETRILMHADRDVRVEVVSRTLDAATLMRIADSVGYDADRDQLAPIT